MSHIDPSVPSALRSYSYADLTRKDISSVCHAYPTLQQSTENFTFNDGTSRLLVKLQGVVPITYRGNTYNFPIDIYFLESHPYNPPMAYVRPTSTMLIKPTRHVDNNGKVYHPYLSEWSHPRSETKELLRILQGVFGEQPPLYSRSSATPSTGGNTNPPTTTPGYPPSNPNMPQPYGQGGYVATPPYGAGTGGYMPGTGWTPTGGGNSGGGLPYPVGNTNYTAYPNAGGGTAYATNTITDADLHKSLVSAVEHSIRRQCREIEEARMCELEVLRHTKESLEQNRALLEERLQKAKSEKDEVQNALEEVQKSNQQLEAALNDLQKQEDFNIDEAVDATHPLYKQMVSCYAEEQAITDAIYFLGEALGKSVIDVEMFLKKVRNLSRKQFMLRATLQKCRVQAGLPSL